MTTKKLLCFGLLGLISCGNPTTQNQQLEATAPPLKKYVDVSEMIRDTYGYKKELGLFKLISKNPLHIQVSKQIVQGDLEEVIQDIVKRDIVYVAFGVFARMDLNEIIITSVPVQWDMQKNKSLGYVDKYKKTILVKREQGKKVLNKYYNHSDFTKLFGDTIIGGEYLPTIPNKWLKNFLYNDREPGLNIALNSLQ